MPKSPSGKIGLVARVPAVHIPHVARQQPLARDTVPGRCVTAAHVVLPSGARLAAAVGTRVVQSTRGVVIRPWRERVGAVGAHYGHVEAASAVVLPRLGTIGAHCNRAHAAGIAPSAVISAHIWGRCNARKEKEGQNTPNHWVWQEGERHLALFYFLLK